MSLAEAINQRGEYHSLDELKQTVTSVEKMINKFPFLSGELKEKIRFYKQKLDVCQTENDLCNLSQELLDDFNDHNKGSLGELTNEMTKSWGARLVLRQCGLKRSDPMQFIRNKLCEALNTHL